MIYPGFEALLPLNWRPIPGDGKHIERPAQTPVKVWTWDGFTAVESEGTLFERVERMPEPSAIGVPMYLWRKMAEEARNTPNPTKQPFYVFSVADGERGYSNPFRDYYINSPSPGSLYKWTRLELLEAVCELLQREFLRVAPEYNRIARQKDAVYELLEKEHPE